MLQKSERRDPSGFSNIHSIGKQKNWRGDPLENSFSEKKVSQCRKKLKGGLFSLSVWYGTWKKEKAFWFSSPGRMIQFGTIKFCRTFVELL